MSQATNIATQVAIAIVTGLEAQAIANAELAEAQLTLSGPYYRPVEWGSQQPYTSIVTTPYTDTNGNNVPSQMFVFDGVFQVEHEKTYEKTKLPVQTGAAVSDHIYLQPVRLVLEIGMSDAFDSYTSSMWSGYSSKSVNAFQTLLTLGDTRLPFTVNTRLATYSNMTIDSINVPDNFETIFGLKATITLSETFFAQVVTTVVSARPQTATSTPQGNVNPINPTSSQVQQHTVNPLDNMVIYNGVPGAGNLSSSNVSQLP